MKKFRCQLCGGPLRNNRCELCGWKNQTIVEPGEDMSRDMKILQSRQRKEKAVQIRMKSVSQKPGGSAYGNAQRTAPKSKAKGSTAFEKMVRGESVKPLQDTLNQYRSKVYKNMERKASGAKATAIVPVVITVLLIAFAIYDNQVEENLNNDLSWETGYDSDVPYDGAGYVDLKAGTYLVGEDIDPGIYDIYVFDGKGEFVLADQNKQDVQRTALDIDAVTELDRIEIKSQMELTITGDLLLELSYVGDIEEE